MFQLLATVESVEIRKRKMVSSFSFFFKRTAIYIYILLTSPCYPCWKASRLNVKLAWTMKLVTFPFDSFRISLFARWYKSYPWEKWNLWFLKIGKKLINLTNFFFFFGRNDLRKKREKKKNVTRERERNMYLVRKKDELNFIEFGIFKVVSEGGFLVTCQFFFLCCR